MNKEQRIARLEQQFSSLDKEIEQLMAELLKMGTTEEEIRQIMDEVHLCPSCDMRTKTGGAPPRPLEH